MYVTIKCRFTCYYKGLYLDTEAEHRLRLSKFNWFYWKKLMLTKRADVVDEVERWAGQYT